MSKRAQESTSEEGSAVAKPRPMNLVSRNLLSGMKTPPQDSSASNSSVNQEFGSELCFIERQETDAKHQPTPNKCVLKGGNKMTLNLPAPGKWGGELNLEAQPAP